MSGGSIMQPGLIGDIALVLRICKVQDSFLIVWLPEKFLGQLLVLQRCIRLLWVALHPVSDAANARSNTRG